MNKYIVLIGIFWSLSTSLITAQSIEVNCVSTPLNELLIEWRTDYNLQFSFNDEALSQYKLSLNESFSNIDNALHHILKDLPLAYELNSGVYIIYPSQKKHQSKSYKLIGKIIEQGSGEPLPFSHILANNQQAVTDIKGIFSFNFIDDSIYTIKASHLGCYILDTVLVAGNEHVLSLSPSAVGIKEITVTNNIVEKSTQIGEAPGLININHHIANYLPGNGDNSVFNLLRLQPGILAAGEQPNDLIIWGSPEGTSRVYFDGFTIWGLKNFSDNISAVNPYLAKNIEIEKGGYDASNSDVVGGFVNISGKNGSTNNAGINLFINNQTINGMVELPVLNKSSLMLAFRQTYYNLFGAEDLKYLSNNNNNEYTIDASPNYQFRDFNIKYSLQGDNGDLFYVSMLQGDDNFKVNASQERPKITFDQHTQENNQQLGGAIFYGKTWKSGNSSNVLLSYSALQSDYQMLRERTLNNYNFKEVTKDEISQNDVAEVAIKLEYKILLGSSHVFRFGGEFIQNEVILNEDTFSYRYIDLEERANRISIFAQDKVQLNHRLSLTAGLRYNYSAFTAKMFLDPRLSLSYRVTADIKINASYGRYHQFLVKSSFEDEDGNFRYSWTNADEQEIPVVSSTHYVLGGAYARTNFMCSIDGFYKSNDGLTYYVRGNQNSQIYAGNSRSYGMDIYAKQDFKGHSVWASYSLGKTEDYYPFYRGDEYRRAAQDQRHEIKLAALFNIKSFHLSASYIYGSGFPIYTSFINNVYTEPNYNRLDASLIYRLSSQKFTGEVGLSFLNITNADNIKYNQFSRVPLDQVNTIYINSESVPFTPLLFLKLHF